MKRKGRQTGMADDKEEGNVNVMIKGGRNVQNGEERVMMHGSVMRKKGKERILLDKLGLFFHKFDGVNLTFTCMLH